MKSKEYYKNTKCEYLPLGEFCKVYSGGTPKRTEKKFYTNGTIPWLKSGELNLKKIVKCEEYITEEALVSSSAKLVEPNTILLALYGATAGVLAITKIKASINQAILAIIPNEIFKKDFLYYSLEQIMPNAIKRLTQGGQPNLNANIVKRLKVLIFPLEEQQKIADILTTWDKAIELKEKLVEEKKKKKNGLMQRLLTGKVRLKGFKSEWKEVKLGNVLKERKETNFNELELLAITGKKGVVRRNQVNIKDNSNEDKSKYKRICKLDIGYNTMRMWQGVSGVSEYEGIVSPAYTILKPTEKVNSYFIGYLFKLPQIINLFWRNSQGLTGDTLNLKYPNLKVIRVKLPMNLEEQKAIANLLLIADKEIELLNKEVEALKVQKKGLMQLLLTGIVRVNNDNKQ